MRCTLGAVGNPDATAVLHHPQETGDFKFFRCFLVFILGAEEGRSSKQKSSAKTQTEAGRMSLLYLGLGHAVEMQIPPVGHIRQQVAVVDRVAVQMHTLGLDQQDYI